MYVFFKLYVECQRMLQHGSIKAVTIRTGRQRSRAEEWKNCRQQQKKDHRAATAKKCLRSISKKMLHIVLPRLQHQEKQKK